LRLRLPDALKLVKANADACRQLVDHIDNCSECKRLDEICPAGKPIQDAYRTAKMRSRLYFGKDFGDEATDSNPILSQE
jgi:Na+-translocating ferredoxin:NAD+ oxidoreductase RnfC subunit